GQSMGIVSNGLIVGETLTFDGSAETDGFYQIFAGAGNDTINASQGADLISGGGGGDTLTGNGGDDTFLYNSLANSTPADADQITDFTTGDVIRLAGIDADTGVSGNQAFTFIGSSAFSSTAGELRAVNTSGNDWRVEADNDGDGTADLEIDVTTADGNPLDAGDFIL
ncbi:MAG: M10 family metallopeptidase C-terminal domain-containing protein, partial [Pseudomonadota bacterium]